MRVRLHFPSALDGEELIALNRASVRFHRGWVAAPVSADRFEAFLLRSHEPEMRSFLIRRLEDNALLGVVNLSSITRRLYQNAVLSYYLGAPFAGQGYMTEACSLAVDHAFSVERLHRVEANIQPNNAPSLAVVQRLGFRLEGYSPRMLKICGRWRDHQRWAILREEWRGLKRSQPAVS